MKSWMYKFLFLVSLIVGLASTRVEAQQTATGSLTTASSGVSDCIPSNCVDLPLTAITNTVTISVQGTHNGTEAFEYSADNRATWAALTAINTTSFSTATGVTTTGTGTWTFANPNWTHVRVRQTAYTSGTATVIVRGTNNGSVVGVHFGGGGTTIGAVTQGTASASEQWLVNCVTGCSGGTSDTDDGSIAGAQATGLGLSLHYYWTGSIWAREIGGTAGTPGGRIQTIQGVSGGTAVPVSGTFFQATQPISATSLPLPTGAATSAAQATANTSLANLETSTDGLETLIGTSNTNLSNLNGKLPSTAAMADGVSNPTLSQIQSYMMCYNGTTWDRCTGSIASSLAHHISIGTSEDEFQVKSGSGVWTGYSATNTASTVAFLRCSNNTAAGTTPGTTTVIYGVAIPGNTVGAGIAPYFPVDGVSFTTGLTCWIVTGEAENDVTEVGANKVNVNVYYR